MGRSGFGGAPRQARSAAPSSSDGDGVERIARTVPAMRCPSADTEGRVADVLSNRPPAGILGKLHHPAAGGGSSSASVEENSSSLFIPGHPGQPQASASAILKGLFFRQRVSIINGFDNPGFFFQSGPSDGAPSATSAGLREQEAATASSRSAHRFDIAPSGTVPTPPVTTPPVPVVDLDPGVHAIDPALSLMSMLGGR